MRRDIRHSKKTTVLRLSITNKFSILRLEVYMKKKLILGYLIAGCVWCIIGLPNLLAKTNGNPFKATGLVVFRIIACPVLSIMYGINKYKEIKAEKQV